MQTSRSMRRRGADALVYLAPCVVIFIFTSLVGYILWHGIPHLSWDFLISEPRMSGRAGGIAPILVSTLAILSVCLLFALPLGLGTALLLAEYSPPDHAFGKIVRTSLDILAGVPSIVFGLFGNALFAKIFGFGFSILSGGLTLACMVLPLLIRVTEEGLRSVPQEYRLGAAALGFKHTSTLFHLIIPAAMPALMVGTVLSVGRALAETAALVFTSGYVDRMPESWFDSGRALSVHIYDLAMNVPGGDRAAYASSLVLIAVLVLINTLASSITHLLMKKKVRS